MRFISSLAIIASLVAGVANATPTATTPGLAARHGGGGGWGGNNNNNNDNRCGKGEFFYGKRSCCLSHGGPTRKPKPPADVDCPPSWYWHHGQGCCVPEHPNPPKPSCRGDWNWQDGRQCCIPRPHPPPPPSPPKPSPKPGNGHGNPWGGNGNPWGGNNGNPWGGNNGHGGGHNDHDDRDGRGGYGGGHHKVKRNFQDGQWDTSICPSGLKTCPIAINGLLTSDTECVDPLSDLTSCGGCVSLGQGQDCSKIPHATLASCQGGLCIVEACAAGFEPSDDDSSCVRA